MHADSASTPTLTLSFDAASAERTLALLSELSRILEPHAFKALLNRRDFLAEVTRFEADVMPAGTSECVVRLNPSDRLRDMLSAYGAGKVNGLIVEK